MDLQTVNRDLCRSYLPLFEALLIYKRRSKKIFAQCFTRCTTIACQRERDRASASIWHLLCLDLDVATAYDIRVIPGGTSADS